jgi:hypothetical protein
MVNDLIQRVYHQFGIGPLDPNRQKDLYVELDQVRGNRDAAIHLKNIIRRSEGQPTCQVLAGHNGSGKSTELLRLKKDLESIESPFFVVYIKADDEIDRNDVDFPDILVAIIRQLAAQLKEFGIIDLKQGFFKQRLERLKGILTSEVDLQSLELSLGMLKLGGQMRASPDARREIRKLFEPDTNNWLYAANDVIGKAILELKKKNRQGLVILIDDLDKMTVRSHETGCPTDEYLFVNRAAQLTAFQCNVIYTIPLSLAYSHLEPVIKSRYSGHVPVVPMTKIANRPPKTGAYSSGVDKFKQIISRRLKAAETGDKEVFEDDNVQNELVALSGGQPDELMRLIREAIISHDLPIRLESLKRLKIDGQREFKRLIRIEHWPIIQEIKQNGEYMRKSDQEQVFRELLNSRAILQYVNDDEWYGLNPMMEGLKPPETIIHKK